ncbi:GNAT family N-acetyltransferase [Parabacteroides johnsonii]|uniref:N-acetyltransferase domain-containing protein n=1 Tax=Parabacteroides johnsonii CL02T12C29 TaxID=999419 RepID=K5YUV5_9BACT|nr:hypothetical protein [Parabacteroides johnsonii]EKN06839.1 hypothetical protein HMPREF1077_03107 [Parabacteroides johnsonii CL02T12C29]
MIYELAYIIKERLSFIWDVIEWGNAKIFSLIYDKELQHLDEVIDGDIVSPYKMRVVNEKDIPALLMFFESQPKDSFNFFNPHKFDKCSIQKIVDNRVFITFVLTERQTNEDMIVGYAFMRSFVNGSAYRGYIVDAGHRGKDLAKIIGKGLNRVGDALDLKMYKSISPENIASMKVTQAMCDIEILKTLSNGDCLVRCMSKDVRNVKIYNREGKCYFFLVVNQAVTPQFELRYAA